jgi:hypothetical protein
MINFKVFGRNENTNLTGNISFFSQKKKVKLKKD